MAAGTAGTTFDINPLQPQGSDSLKLGDDVIRQLATGILRALGFTGDTEIQGIGPFGVDPATGLATVVGEPVAPLGIATKSSAGRKALYASVSARDSLTFQGTTDPPTSSPYDQDAIYIIQNASGDNAGASTLELNSGGAAPLVHADGSQLNAGDFVKPAVYAVMWNTEVSQWRFLNFIGGSVPDPITLPANPTTALQAAPKQYVDTAVGHPVGTPSSNSPVSFGPAAVELWNASITTPNDGNSYLLSVSYWVYVERQAGSEVVATTWVDANGESLALGGAHMNNNAGGSIGSTSGSGIGATVYPANTEITVKVMGQATNTVAASLSDASFPDAPESRLILTLLRTSA